MEVFGWIGSLLFAFCGLPQAVQSYRDKHSNGLNWFFLLAWFFGELFTLAYVLPKHDFPLIVNYLINLFFVTIILGYKVKTWYNNR